MRVLVVDDDENLRLTLSLLLRASGFEVEQAASGEEALERLATTPFDAIVSDVRMGKLSGVDLACQAKRAWPRLRVVLMSGFCGAEELAGAPVEGFTEKPPDVEALVAILRGDCGRKSLTTRRPGG